MGESTGISWTDHTFNPWWGCQRVSPGCERCYAEAFAKRVGQDIWGPESPRRFFGEKHWQEPVKWNRKAEKDGVRRRVFCASMADVFEDRRDLDEWRWKLWHLIVATPALDWQLLTKRPEKVTALVPPEWLAGRWPPNAWLGFTAENQEHFDRRIAHVRGLAVPVLFVSHEPAIGPLSVENGTEDIGLDWIITGGESGHGARGYDVQWARDLIEQGRRTGTYVFVKQLGAKPYQSPRHDGGTGYFLDIKQSKADDPSEWPADLRVQEFPLDAVADTDGKILA